MFLHAPLITAAPVSLSSPVVASTIIFRFPLTFYFMLGIAAVICIALHSPCYRPDFTTHLHQTLTGTSEHSTPVSCSLHSSPPNLGLIWKLCCFEAAEHMCCSSSYFLISQTCCQLMFIRLFNDLPPNHGGARTGLDRPDCYFARKLQF